MHRLRCLVGPIALGASLVASGHALAHPRGEPLTQPGFTLVALPDTQFYSQNAGLIHYFQEQTQWVADNVARRNIKYVSHLGDLVQSGGNGGSDVEWDRADGAMATLDGVVPYSTLPGNHDFESVGNKATGTSSYNQFFGPARYAGQAEYLSSAPDGENHAHLFTAQGVQFLHLALEWQPDATARAWAQSIVDANPGVPTIVATHEHIQDADSGGNGAGRSTAGQATWADLISTNAQIFMVLNGHYHRGPSGEDGEFHLHSVNIAGKSVLEALSDFQGWADGGSGYLRLIRFDIPGSRIDIRSFSPSLGVYQQDANSQYTMPLDFADRFPGATTPTTLALETLIFRNGLKGYIGTADTELLSSAPDADRSSVVSISVDYADGGPQTPNHGLVRFDSVFGAGVGQVATDHDIVHAALRLDVFNPGSGMSIHRMLIPWAESDTWNTMVSGVSADGAEALGAPDTFLGKGSSSVLVPVASLDFDVTPSLRAWQAGETNNGWALLPYTGGTDGIDFDASEGATALARPTLVVTATAMPVQTRQFRQGENAYTGALDIELRASQPDTATEGAALISIDSSLGGLPTQGLIRFDGVFGGAPDQVPAGSVVTSAQLELTILDAGSGFRVHTMLGDWTGLSTWNTLLGGVTLDDTQADRFTMAGAGAPSIAPSVLPGMLRVDVTEAARGWSEGVVNRGVVLVAQSGGSDEVLIASAEFPTVSDRPRLTMRFLPPATCDGDVDGDGVVNVSDVSYVIFRLGNSGAPGSVDGDADGNGTVSVNDIGYVIFRFGACP